MLIGLFCNTNISAETGISFGADFGVLAADNTRVPLYMLMVAVHKELDSDDVPDGRFDILLCRDSSREVGE
ncbi:CBM_collapsed_G0056360.mRNA.1.CDS.1 [Saccharomyces cerevisiae]|nr:CBM_collapsed_G0056360.mRNA.1.CDS.1 [Saccharomyces cerevisiae]